MTKNTDKLDPRVVRTQQMLRDALVSLIAEKGFDALTVQDIADRATLNRATFYLHYKDKQDLLTQSLHGAIDELLTDIGLAKDDSGQLSFEVAERPIVAVFQHVAQHASFYRIMMGAEGVPSFIASVRDYMSDITLQWLTALQPNAQESTVPLEIVASSLSWSMLGVILWWLEHGMPHPPEYMATQFRLLSVFGLRQVLGLEPASAERGVTA
jgi:AcrR family transcriptional regulator